jgi:hypothetical protein
LLDWIDLYYPSVVSVMWDSEERKYEAVNGFNAEETFDELMACRHGILWHFQAVDTCQLSFV